MYALWIVSFCSLKTCIGIPVPPTNVQYLYFCNILLKRDTSPPPPIHIFDIINITKHYKNIEASGPPTVVSNPSIWNRLLNAIAAPPPIHIFDIINITIYITKHYKNIEASGPPTCVIYLYFCNILLNSHENYCLFLFISSYMYALWIVSFCSLKYL